MTNNNTFFEYIHLKKIVNSQLFTEYYKIDTNYLHNIHFEVLSVSSIDYKK